MNLIETIRKKATETKRRILLVEGEELRVIKAASLAVEESICTPVLLGSVNTIKKIAQEQSISLEGCEFLAHEVSDQDVNDLVEIRKHKGLTEEQARKLLENPNYFAALKVAQEEVDSAVGGCKYSTAEWMSPVFQIIGTKKGCKTVSAIAFCELQGKTYFLSDTDFVIDPTQEQLADIAINAADFVKSLGVDPKVALISFSSHGSASHPSLEKIKNAKSIVQEKRSDIVIDGELQVDAAINPDAAQKKVPDSVLKGEANTLIFPHISVGNVLVHALLQWTDTKLYGSFPLGLAKPVVNGGRSSPPQAIKDTILSAALMVNSND